MKEFPLRQHFYASAPVGLSGTRGLQTVASSPELRADGVRELLEGHCRYATIEGFADEELPVNWGWFQLDQLRACIHRVGYSGTDDIGRRGNFMAHNLVVDLSAMELIDFDVPALIEWVRYDSPLKYLYPKTGIEDGFVRRHTQLYDRFGQQRDGLTSIPSLTVPIDRVREIRKALDAQLHADRLPEVIKALGADRTTTIVRAALRRTDAPQSLVVTGLRDGKRESSLERSVMGLLFAFYPAHVRRNMFFSTYHEDPAESVRMTHGHESEPKPHQLLRVVFSPQPVVNDFDSASTNVCIVDVDEPAGSQPPVPEVVERNVRVFVKDASSMTAVRRFRDTASQFDWPSEAAGMEQTERLMQGFARMAGSRTDAPREADYELLDTATASQRYCLVETADHAHRMIAAFHELRDCNQASLRRLTQNYLALVQKPADPTEKEPLYTQLPPKEFGTAVCQLLRLSVRLNNYESLQVLLEFVNTARIGESLRRLIYETFGKMFEGGLSHLTTADASLGLWTVVHRCLQSGTADVNRLLDQIARALVDRVIALDKSTTTHAIDVRVVDLLLAAPMPLPSDFVNRLKLVVKLSRKLPVAQATEIVSVFLRKLVDLNRVSADAYEELSREDSLLFAVFGCRDVLINPANPSAARLLEKFTTLGLLAEYWRGSELLWGSLWQSSYHLITGLYADRRAEVIQTLGSLYLQVGGAKLYEQLTEMYASLNSRDADSLVKAHLDLIQIAGDYGKSLDDVAHRNTAEALCYQHLLRLIVAILRETNNDADLRRLLTEPLRALLQLTEPDEKRLALWFWKIGVDLTKDAPMRSVSIAAIRDRLMTTLRPLCRPDEAEVRAWWLAKLLTLGHQNPASKNWEDYLAPALAELFLDYPGAIVNTPTPSPFRAYLHIQCNGKVWQHIRSKMIQECRVGNNSDEGWRNWFDSARPRVSLIDAMARTMSSDGSTTLLDSIWASIFGDDDQMDLDYCRALALILSFPPHEEATRRARSSLERQLGLFIRYLKEQMNGLDNGAQNGQQLLQWLTDLSRFVLAIPGVTLESAQANDLWPLLSWCVCNATESRSAILQAATCVGVAACHAATNVTSASGPWYDLFYYLSFNRRTMRLPQGIKTPVEMWVEVGDRLFATFPLLEAGQAAKLLAMLKNNKQALSGSNGKEKASMFGRLLARIPLRKPILRDDTYYALCKPSGLVSKNDANSSLRHRALFVACCYAVGPELREVLLAFTGNAGDKPATNPQALGRAFAWLLLPEGPAGAPARARMWSNNPQLDQLHSDFKKRWGDVTASLFDTLTQQGVQSDGAREIADLLGLEYNAPLTAAVVQ